MKTPEAMAGFFKEARIKAGLTQKEVAYALGYSSAQFVSNWERGKCGVPLETLTKLIAVLNLKRSEVIDLILENEQKSLRRSLAIS